ncbi:MAG TPA: S41 family peptidase [Thermoanaerobaculia bacterium]|nr:S41 family peptidase [Thermoanaerobaculia bacterium]
MVSGFVFLISGWVLLSAPVPSATPTPALAPVLAEIDKIIREGFYDPKLKGVDWTAAVSRASADLAKATTPAEKNAVYDRLLSSLGDSHTFRVPPGRLPERGWGTTGLRIGQDGDGYAVKGVLPGSSAEKAGMKIGDRVLEIDGVRYGRDRVDFRDLFLVSEGAPGTSSEVVWKRGDAAPKTDRLVRTAELPGDTLVWKGARVIRLGGKPWGYAHLWGMSAETALAVVDLLLDRKQAERARGGLQGWGEIEGFLLDVRGNSGGYDPNILSTFLQGNWSAGDYYTITREGRRLEPPAYKRLPVALLVNSGTASSGEALTLKFRAHKIGPIVGETTAGMMSGGAAAERLSDGSMLWYTARAIEGLDGTSYEGRGVAPDVAVVDRPAAREGGEDAIVEAAIRVLATPAVSSR